MTPCASGREVQREGGCIVRKDGLRARAHGFDSSPDRSFCRFNRMSFESRCQRATTENACAGKQRRDYDDARQREDAQGYRLNSPTGDWAGQGTSTSMTGTGRSAIWSADTQTGCGQQVLISPYALEAVSRESTTSPST